MITETVSGRSIARYRGEPVNHTIRFYAISEGILARCLPCGWSALLEDGHTAADFARLERQHAGTEDP